MSCLLVVLGVAAQPATAAGPPQLGAAWSFAVQSASARLGAQIGANGNATAYHFDYITRTGYEANLVAGKDGFAGAAKAPSVIDANIGNGSSTLTVAQLLFSLSADTAYQYRLVAKNSAGTVTGPAQVFFTRSLAGGALLPDGRGWELVSPIDKNGGQVDPPGTIAGGGVLQAAANGQSITYGSSTSFEGGSGAPPVSQYVSARGSGGWATLNVSTPIFSGSYATEDEGAPYQLFSSDLSRALLLNGEHCRGQAGGCGVANPPLAGTDAPPGYRNYYLREGGSFAALLRSGDIADLDLDPADFDLRLAGASPDLRHVVLSTCAMLTEDAIEVGAGAGCDPDKPNLYTWSSAAGLRLVNLLPGQNEGKPGAALAAQAGAVSDGGTRIYWNDLETGDLYLREGGQTKLVAAAGTFETAAADGSLAFYTKAQHLFRYDAAAATSTDLTPSGEVRGVLGASADGSHLYYLTASGLFLRRGATAVEVAGSADDSSYPATTGTARVSPDGTHLAFVSTVPLTGYDNTDLNSGSLDSEVYLYDAAADSLTCVSCNPTNGRPIGPSTIPGASANGTTAHSTHLYKPRVLSADGRRVFFDSEDALVATDTNSHSADVYQWEAEGTGSCSRAGGCIALISSGRVAGGASFVDASQDGSDAFFLTDASLIGSDPGALDLYDARVGGGFPEPPAPLPCEGDVCQSLPPAPVDPTLTTLLSGPGNPAVRYHRRRRPQKHHRKHKEENRHRQFRQGGRR